MKKSTYCNATSQEIEHGAPSVGSRTFTPAPIRLWEDGSSWRLLDEVLEDHFSQCHGLARRQTFCSQSRNSELYLFLPDFYDKLIGQKGHYPINSHDICVLLPGSI